MNTLQLVERRIAELVPRRVEGSYPEAAVAIMLTREANPRILLTERAHHLRLHSGEIAFPGGKCDPEDPHYLATALREMDEEVGVSAEQVTPLGELSQCVTLTEIKITPWVGTIPTDLPLTINRDELAGAFYAPLEYFAQPENLVVEEVEYLGHRRCFARYDFQGYRIWGATARILVELVNTVFECGFKIDLSHNQGRGAVK